MPESPGGQRRLRILTVGTGWDSSAGGIATVNRELSIGLAQAGHDVTAWIPEPINDRHPDVDIRWPTNPPVKVEPGDSSGAKLAKHRQMLVSGQGLPEHVDIIVGHAKFTGDLAQQLRDQYYPNAKVVDMVHSSTEEGDRSRNGDGIGADQKAAAQLERMKGADLVVGVGPIITEEAERSAQRDRVQLNVHEMIPGITAQEPPMYRDSQYRYEILMMGRMDDPLKGAPEAVKMVKELRDPGVPAHLVIRGVPADKLQEQQVQVNVESDNAVRLRPYSVDPADLQRDLNGADLVLMPSHTEGFGLVASEAAGAGVPVLMSQNTTGMGMFLNDASRVPPELGKDSTITQGPRNTEAWADRIQGVLQNLPAERERALGLREHLTNNYSWKAAGENMVAAVEKLNTLPLTQEQATLQMATAGLAAPGTEKSLGKAAAGPTASVSQLGERNRTTPNVQTPQQGPSQDR